VGTTRELEYNLNDDIDQGKALRSRYQAMIDRSRAETQKGFIEDFIKTMDEMGILDSHVRLTGSFGIHLREKSFILDSTTVYSIHVQGCPELRNQSQLMATNRKQKPHTQLKEVQNC